MENDFALTSKENKSKGKKSQGEEGGKKMDLSKVKCFHYHEHGHYATNFPQKKERKKDPVVAATCEALASQFELHFTSIACIDNTVIGSVWYLDIDVSFH